MVSEAAICSGALQLVGQSSIQNLTDDNDRARKCAELYPVKRDALLRKYRWKFATKWQELSANAVNYSKAYGNSYLIPGNCLRVLSVNDTDPEFSPPQDVTWDIEGSNIVTDERAPIKVKYISRETNTSRFDASFIACLELYLAKYLSASYREVSPNQLGVWEELFQQELRDARYVGSIEARPQLRSPKRPSWSYWGR